MFGGARKRITSFKDPSLLKRINTASQADLSAMESLIDPDAQKSQLSKQRRGAVANSMKRSWAVLKRQRERIQRWISILMCIFGIILVAIIVVGAVFLQMAELCRYPINSLGENYSYTIDLYQTPALTAYDPIAKQWVSPVDLPADVKITQLRGGRIRNITLDSGYGSYVIKASTGSDDNTIKIFVDNRSKQGSRKALESITTMKVTPVKVMQGVGKEQKEETWYDLDILSKTNNKNSGPSPCTRADIVVTIPAACLLDETNLEIKAPKSQILMESSVFDATLKNFRMTQDIGWIEVNGMSANRGDLSTGNGKITADKVSAHVLLLEGKADGAVIEARNVSLFSSDTDCKTVSVYAPGFPEEEAYRTDVIKCAVEAGKLTVESEGAENGGKPALVLDNIRGGSIITSLRLGKTLLKTQACVGFVGTYNLVTNAGKTVVNKVAGPTNALLVMPTTNKTTIAPAAGTVEESKWLEDKRASAPDYPWPDPWWVKNGRTGSICMNFTGYQREQGENREMKLEARYIGDITVDVTEPYIGTIAFD